MAQVSLGIVYQIVDFNGRRRGGRVFGGYLPPRSATWKRIHELNIPPLSMHKCWAAVSRNPDAMQGLALGGLVWHLIGIAAETPIPGALVEWDGELVRGMNDAEIAERLGLPLQSWTAAVRLLQVGGSGCGFLTARELSIDVSDASMQERYRRCADARRTDPRQMSLPLFFDEARSIAAPARPNDTKDVDADVNDTKRNESAHAAQRTGAATRNERVDSALLEGPGEGHTVIDPERRLLKWVQTEQQPDALDVWLGIMEQRLKPGQANKGDRSQWARAFVRCWNDGRNENEPKRRAAARWAALCRVLDAAAEIRADPQTRNPASRMCDWLIRNGLAEKGVSKCER